MQLCLQLRFFVLFYLHHELAGGFIFYTNRTSTTFERGKKSSIKIPHCCCRCDFCCFGGRFAVIIFGSRMESRSDILRDETNTVSVDCQGWPHEREKVFCYLWAIPPPRRHEESWSLEAVRGVVAVERGGKSLIYTARLHAVLHWTDRTKRCRSRTL